MDADSCASRKLEFIDYTGNSGTSSRHEVAPEKASGYPSLLVISDIARWEGTTHDEGIRPLFSLFRVFDGSIPTIPTNGNCSSPPPALCLPKKRAKASGETRRSNPLVLYRQSSQGVEGVFGLCPAKDRHRMAKAPVSRSLAKAQPE